jgi:hypothetical protein
MRNTVNLSSPFADCLDMNDWGIAENIYKYAHAKLKLE